MLSVNYREIAIEVLTLWSAWRALKWNSCSWPIYSSGKRTSATAENCDGRASLVIKKESTVACNFKRFLQAYVSFDGADYCICNRRYLANCKIV